MVPPLPTPDPTGPSPTTPSAAVLDELARRSLDEDLHGGDMTTDSLIPEDARALGIVRAREEGVLAGLAMACAVFRAVDPELSIATAAEDGSRIDSGSELCRIRGSARSILKAERTALNFLQRLCGIATLTARFVEEAADTSARIVDTRKTTPGLRALEKHAVVCGGGGNHRFDLSDGFLLKDNHQVVLDRLGISLSDALADARAVLPEGTPLEVEVDDPARISEALAAGADVLLLDNFTPDQLRAAVTAVAGRAVLEASGGVTVATVRAVAETGVDLISVGALTHSATALDLGMDFEMEP